MTVVETPLLSTRTRVALPFSLLSAWVARAIPALACNPDARQELGDGDALASLLSLIPVDFSGYASSEQFAKFADIAAQLAAAGINPPSSIDDDAPMRLWSNATYPLVIAEPFATKAMLLTRSLLGFDATDLDQALEFGAPSNVCAMFRGRFDPEAVVRAWTANGYNILEVEGTTVASLHEDAKLDVQSEIGRIALAAMNNAAFLADGTLAYAPTLPLLTEIVETAAGAAAPLARRVDVDVLLRSIGAPVASAILFDGSMLSNEINPRISPDALQTLRSELESSYMPPLTTGLIGMTPGGPSIKSLRGNAAPVTLPPAMVVLRLLMATPGTADAAAMAVDSRLRSMHSPLTQRPYAALFSSWEIEPSEDGMVLAVDLAPADGVSAAIWSQLIDQQDLLFLAW